MNYLSMSSACLSYFAREVFLAFNALRIRRRFAVPRFQFAADNQPREFDAVDVGNFSSPVLGEDRHTLVTWVDTRAVFDCPEACLSLLIGTCKV